MLGLENTPEALFYSIVSVLLAVVAFFVKQLHNDFKRVEKDVAEVKTTTSLIKAEFKGINDLMNQKIEFLEKRLHHIETFIYKTRNHADE